MGPVPGTLPTRPGMDDPASRGASREFASLLMVGPASKQCTRPLPWTQQRPGLQGLGGDCGSHDELKGRKCVPRGWTALGSRSLKAHGRHSGSAPGPTPTSLVPPGDPAAASTALESLWAQAKRQTRLPGPHAGETLPELFSWLRREMWAPSTTPLNTAGAFQPVVGADSALLTRRPSLKLGSDPPTLQVRKEPEASRAWA